jgi:hypothetical protein
VWTYAKFSGEFIHSFNYTITIGSAVVTMNVARISYTVVTNYMSRDGPLIIRVFGFYNVTHKHI